jgi:hypothetical protein
MLLNRHAFISKPKLKTWLAGIMEALKQVISDTLPPLSLAFISLALVCPRSGRKQLLIRVVSSRRSMFLDQVSATSPGQSLSEISREVNPVYGYAEQAFARAHESAY